MARNISKESLEQKIEKIEKAISKNREQYDRLTAELEELHKKQKALQSEELLKAIEGSSRSYEEILSQTIILFSVLTDCLFYLFSLLFQWYSA